MYLCIPDGNTYLKLTDGYTFYLYLLSLNIESFEKVQEKLFAFLHPQFIAIYITSSLGHTYGNKTEKYENDTNQSKRLFVASFPNISHFSCRCRKTFMQRFWNEELNEELTERHSKKKKFYITLYLPTEVLHHNQSQSCRFSFLFYLLFTSNYINLSTIYYFFLRNVL